MNFSRAALLAVVALAFVVASAEAVAKASPPPTKKTTVVKTTPPAVKKSPSPAPQKYTSPVDYVTKNMKSFGTLIAAATAAGLVPTLSDPKLKATLFLPNDAAFNAFVKETNTNLTALVANKAQLTAVLTYHVHAGEALTNFKVGTTAITTLAKQNITATRTGNVVKLKDATGRTVNFADYKAVKAGASTIFLIKSVLLPKTA